VKIDKIELYYVKIPLSKEEPGFFSERPVFHPNWIPGYHQTDMRFYLLKLSTDSGLDGCWSGDGVDGRRQPWLAGGSHR